MSDIFYLLVRTKMNTKGQQELRNKLDEISAYLQEIRTKMGDLYGLIDERPPERREAYYHCLEEEDGGEEE